MPPGHLHAVIGPKYTNIIQNLDHTKSFSTKILMTFAFQPSEKSLIHEKGISSPSDTHVQYGHVSKFTSEFVIEYYNIVIPQKATTSIKKVKLETKR